MKIPEVLESQCAAVLGSPVLGSRFIGGGDVAHSCLVQTKEGAFFLKYLEGPLARSPFESEAMGLDLLSGRSPLRIPKVISFGQAGDFHFLLLEYIETGQHPGTSFWEVFGAGLAELHRNRAPQFGLGFDNFIGKLPQQNAFRSSWPDFFRELRLEPQFRLALDLGLLPLKSSPQIEALYAKLPEIFPAESPALIHGDLWSGNYLVSTAFEAVLVDPSVSFSHREMDLAMSRLFSGFDWRFYRAYEESYPLAPGFENRIPIYQLYYLLVHLNIFGRGYLPQVLETLEQF
ncbi:MAG: fructosamine kinase family protein [Saprospirales bacterium]|nr:fructosamine kinase family protein [Saprospirales bacterium]